MIGSILEAWRGTLGSEQAPRAGTACVSRAGFLRMMAAGAIVAGLEGRTAAAATPARAAPVPPVTDIEALYDAWQERLNHGDLEGLVDLYLDDVTYINPEGKSMSGKAAVREDFIALLALKPHIVLGNRKHILYHDIALTTNHWRMTFTNANGVGQELTGGGIEVMRKQADGGWRYIIDDASRSASS